MNVIENDGHSRLDDEVGVWLPWPRDLGPDPAIRRLQASIREAREESDTMSDKVKEMQ